LRFYRAKILKTLVFRYFSINKGILIRKILLKNECFAYKFPYFQYLLIV
jgi:hypothetical protein